MTHLHSKQDFLQSAHAFKDRLRQVGTFNEIMDLWRSTNLPYTYDTKDPFSDEYRNEVLKTYTDLTEESYSSENEMTSTRLSAEDFRRGYPWISNNLEVVSQETAKVIQAMRALHARGRGQHKIIEFGAGWGNLAVPLAKAGQDVTVVDIDKAFLDRIATIAANEHVTIKSLHGDFCEVARTREERYDVAAFQASFHHCLDFSQMLRHLRENVLTETGCILFFSEPVFKDYSFPWGLRYDGESLWAITINKWLELGFDRDFFTGILLRSGFLAATIPGIDGFVGEGWSAEVGPNGIPFETWTLPDRFDGTFHSGGAAGTGRFCRAESRLPGLRDCALARYKLLFHNFGARQMTVRVSSSGPVLSARVEPGASREIVVDARCDDVLLQSDVFVPAVQMRNGDTRELGLSLLRVALA